MRRVLRGVAEGEDDLKEARYPSVGGGGSGAVSVPC